jgi:selT/selW/selH-like putative selenoprotein
LAAELKHVFPDAEVRLIQSSGGVFEVTVDGTLLFSKKALRRHAEPGEVLGLVRGAAGQGGGEAG